MNKQCCSVSISSYSILLFLLLHFYDFISYNFFPTAFIFFPFLIANTWSCLGFYFPLFIKCLYFIDVVQWQKFFVADVFPFSFLLYVQFLIISSKTKHKTNTWEVIHGVAFSFCFLFFFHFSNQREINCNLNWWNFHEKRLNSNGGEKRWKRDKDWKKKKLLINIQSSTDKVQRFKKSFIYKCLSIFFSTLFFLFSIFFTFPVSSSRFHFNSFASKK